MCQVFFQFYNIIFVESSIYYNAIKPLLSYLEIYGELLSYKVHVFVHIFFV